MRKLETNFKPRVVDIPYFDTSMNGHPDPVGELGADGNDVLALYRSRSVKGRLFLLFFMALFIVSCDSIKYIPVKTTETKTEYVDRFRVDSIHEKDSVFVLVKGDTVYRDRTKTVYRDRYSRDTIYVSQRDTILDPYPVEIVKERYRVPKSMWWLVILLAGLSVPSIIKILRKFRLIKI